MILMTFISKFCCCFHLMICHAVCLLLFHNVDQLLDFYLIYRKFRGQEPLIGYFETRTPQFLILSPDIARKVLTTHFASFHDNGLW